MKETKYTVKYTTSFKKDYKRAIKRGLKIELLEQVVALLAMGEPLPDKNRRARRLVHECCNYIDGNCIALDDGEECICVQSISYSLLCRWFRAAVLPQDKELETALFHRLNAKKCAVCGALFTPGSNRAKYCPECAARMKRINAAKRKRKQREKCHALGAEKPL